MAGIKIDFGDCINSLMSLSFNDSLAHAILNSMRVHINSLSGTPSLRIYAAGAIPGAKVLATFTLSNDVAPAATGKALTFTTPPEVKASDSGDAAQFQIGVLSDASGQAVLRGSISDATGTGDLKLNKIAIVKDEPVSIVEMKITLP